MANSCEAMVARLPKMLLQKETKLLNTAPLAAILVARRDDCIAESQIYLTDNRRAHTDWILVVCIDWFLQDNTTLKLMLRVPISPTKVYGLFRHH